ncbi:MAG: hypothetical protein ACRC33_01650 [Gemmataceae bacterium]
MEMFFSVLSRKLLRRDDFASAEGFAERLGAWMAWYNKEWAHPYRWTYAGTPLVRDTPFDRTLRQKKRGQAFAGTRPKFHYSFPHPLPHPRRRETNGPCPFSWTVPPLPSPVRRRFGPTRQTGGSLSSVLIPDVGK